MKRFFLTTLMLAIFAGTALAGSNDVEFNATTTNEQFGDIVREAGIAAVYRGIAPAEPLGLLGFDIGVEASFVDIDTSTWEPAIDSGDSDPPSVLPVPRIHARKGLPFNIDVGASYATAPDSNIEIIGAELQWALLEGTVATPAVALRGHYSTLEGVDDLDLETYGADALISKGFTLLTPYAGIGVFESEGAYTGDDPFLQATLDDQTKTETRYFGGMQISLALLAITLEAEYSDIPVYSAKFSLNW